MAKLNFSKVGQTLRSRSGGQKIWYHVKGLVTSNTHVQYESSITSGKKYKKTSTWMYSPF